MRCTVDTNVAVVANGRGSNRRGARPPALKCQEAAVDRLLTLAESGTIVLDLAGVIQSEYRRHLNPRGQPGTGDQFLLLVINSDPGRVERVELPKRADGSYRDFPAAAALRSFDPDDRVFAALSRREGIPVVTAIDSDWLDHRAALAANGVQVEFVCGCNQAGWFAP